MIEWHLLGKAMAYYQNKGYRYVEVPWIVQNVFNMITCPHEDLLMKIDGTNASLIGSAEQGFLALELTNQLPKMQAPIGQVPSQKGKYVSCTPCFRVEPNIDAMHRSYFMKVELYQTDDTSIDAMYQMIQDAEDFFHTARMDDGRQPSLKRIDTGEGVDITIHGVEVGSYGIRSFSSHKWVYGTGLALPRFTQSLGAWKRD